MSKEKINFCLIVVFSVFLWFIVNFITNSPKESIVKVDSKGLSIVFSYQLNQVLIFKTNKTGIIKQKEVVSIINEKENNTLIFYHVLVNNDILIFEEKQLKGELR